MQAIHVTIDNVHDIIAYAKSLDFDLNHLPDSIAYNLTNNEDTVLVMDGTARNNNITFTDMPSSQFFSTLQFLPVNFRTVEPIY